MHSLWDYVIQIIVLILDHFMKVCGWIRRQRKTLLSIVNHS